MVIKLERLQKYMARSGVTSRRKAEEMIKKGLVRVNGTIITEMGVKVNPLEDEIDVAGKKILPEEKKVYVLLNKPLGVVTTMNDPQGRKIVTDLLKDIKERIYPIGRLDYNTEGLLLLTNDGELAYHLTHPRFEINKTYFAKVNGYVTELALKELRQGVMLADGLTKLAFVKLLKRTAKESSLEITIQEGRNRQVRRMCEKVGHAVSYLKRIRLGFLELEDLQVGQYRCLKDFEVKKLKIDCKLTK